MTDAAYIWGWNGNKCPEPPEVKDGGFAIVYFYAAMYGGIFRVHRAAPNWRGERDYTFPALSDKPLTIDNLPGNGELRRLTGDEAAMLALELELMGIKLTGIL